MNPLTQLIAWLKTNEGIASGQADYFRGVWKDNANNAQRRLVSVIAVGPNADGILLDKAGFRVLLLGGQTPVAGESEQLHNILDAIRQRLKEDYKTCGVAQIKVIGGIIGPGATTEGRPWYEINLQLIIL